jgi:hypothetical protein
MRYRQAKSDPTNIWIISAIRRMTACGRDGEEDPWQSWIRTCDSNSRLV